MHVQRNLQRSAIPAGEIFYRGGINDCHDSPLVPPQKNPQVQLVSENSLKGAVCLYVNAMPPRFSAWFLCQPGFIAAKISPAIDSNKSAPRPAQSPTLSPTKSAMTAGFRGSSSGMSDSTFPEKKMKSKEYRVITEGSYTLASPKFDK